MRRLIWVAAMIVCLTVLCGVAQATQPFSTHEILKGQEMRRLPAPCK